MNWYHGKWQQRILCMVMAAMITFYSTGCATMAHRSSSSGYPVRSTSDCSGTGKRCPWLAADALLLLAGIIPGVIAFIVDIDSGAWNHENLSRVEGPAEEVESLVMGDQGN